jgi:hypothetical protein
MTTSKGFGVTTSLTVGRVVPPIVNILLNCIQHLRATRSARKSSPCAERK